MNAESNHFPTHHSGPRTKGCGRAGACFGLCSMQHVNTGHRHSVLMYINRSYRIIARKVGAQLRMMAARRDIFGASTLVLVLVVHSAAFLTAPVVAVDSRHGLLG